MGCFNKTAFYSHLPIHCGDEIVVLVCADQSRSTKRDQCPISVVGTNLIPIALPFFGTYDDYGSIEKVVDDENHKLFTKKIGMPLEKFCNMMHDLSGITIADLKEGIKCYKECPEAENHCHLKTKEDFENLLKLYEKIFKKEDYFIDRLDSLISNLKEDDDEKAESIDDVIKTLHESYNNLSVYEEEKYNNTSIIVIMEHKTIYDKMVEVGRKTYNNYTLYMHKETPEEIFDRDLWLYNLLKSKENPLTFNMSNEAWFGATNCRDLSNEDDKRIKEFIEYSKGNRSSSIGMMCSLDDSTYSSNVDYALYNDFSEFSLNDFRDSIIEYAYFLCAFKRTNTTFEVSPYHSQTTCYDTIVPLYEKMLEIVKEKAKNS